MFKHLRLILQGVGTLVLLSFLHTTYLAPLLRDPMDAGADNGTPVLRASFSD